MNKLRAQIGVIFTIILISGCGNEQGTTVEKKYVPRTVDPNTTYLNCRGSIIGSDIKGAYYTFNKKSKTVQEESLSLSEDRPKGWTFDDGGTYKYHEGFDDYTWTSGSFYKTLNRETLEIKYTVRSVGIEVTEECEILPDNESFAESLPKNADLWIQDVKSRKAQQRARNKI